jgi:uncharacterized protein YeaO (DUF488 family)
MSIHIVRLGQPRRPGEGLRIGTVRHPPRGLPRGAWATGDWFDVWYPELAPSAELLRATRATTIDAASWRRFARLYRREMASPAARHAIELLAALSRESDFAVGCYCADAARCHRSFLASLLRGSGARLADPQAGLS